MHLKKYLTKFFHEDHIYSRKIGFHAPTTKYIYDNCYGMIKSSIDFLPKWLNHDKTLIEIERRCTLSANNDYFLYSIYNLIQMEKMNASKN